MTNTKIIAAGVLAAAGSNRALAVKVTLPASTKEFTLEAIVTNGASSESSRILPIELNFATSNLDGVADTIATSLELFSEGKRAQLKHTAGLLTFIRSKPLAPTGSLLYAWIQHSALPANAAIDLWLNTIDEAAGTGGGTPGVPAGSVQSVQGVELGTPIAAMGRTIHITSAPAVTAALYAAGNSIGGKIVLANAVRIAGGSSRLENIQLLDRSNTKPSGYILFFNADPTLATLADKTAFVFSTDDLKVIGRVDVSSADWITINSKAVADVPYAGRLLKSAATTSLWAAWIAGTTVPTFVSTTDIQMIFKLSYAD